MSPEISERAFEAAIECALLRKDFKDSGCKFRLAYFRPTTAVSSACEDDKLDDDDKFMRHLAQVVRNGLGDRSSTCIDPRTRVVEGKTVCLVSCQHSPEPVFLRWKGLERSDPGDFYVRSGPGPVRLGPDDTEAYIRSPFESQSGSLDVAG